MFIGNSITQFCPINELLDRNDILNRGIGSDGVKGLLNRINNTLLSKPSKIFIEIGINDILEKMKNDSIVYYYGKILNTIKTKSPKTRIYIESVLPISNNVFNTTKYKNLAFNVALVNNGLKHLSNKTGSIYVDLYYEFQIKGEMNPELTFDGIHLSSNGYLKWANIIKAYL